MNPIRLTSFINAFFALCLLALAAPARADLFVSSYLTGSVQEFTTSGSLVGSFVAAGSGGLFNPTGLHFGPDGNLYVVSPRAIKVYDGVTGTYIKDFSSTGALDFTFDAGGNMYAVDNANVKKYDVGGNLLRAYTDGVSTPEGIALSPQGHLLVTNTYDGAYRNTVTDLDPSNGSFSTFATGLGEPVGIIAGPDGRYYLANSTFANSYGGANPDTIQVVGASGGASSTWNRGGGLYGASYLAFAGNQLFVTSFLNGTVQVFDGTTGASLGAFAASSYPLGIAYRAAPVPEPPALVLSAIGVFAVLRWAHRRPKARGRAAT